MQTLFISDLHLSEENEEARQAFLGFLEKNACEKLYILGDFFEAWVGDDEEASWITEICERLKNYNAAVFLMQGNRDFLLGERFARKCGAKFLNDPTLIDLYGIPTVLTHGDVLCTQDSAYQRFRKFSRNAFIQWLFLKLPLATRRKIAQKMRKKSQEYTRNLSSAKMDVSQEAVENLLSRHKASQIIHGHTHQPAIHQEKSHIRYVLPDWHPLGGMVAASAGASPKLIFF